VNDDQPHVNLPPADIVPPIGITADALRRLNTGHHQQLTFSFPGEFYTNPDGNPTGVGESTTVTGIATVRISRAELDSTGLTQKEIDRVRITD